jgi:hypothetical protein
MSTTINAHEPIALSHLHAAACDLAAALAPFSALIEGRA